MHIFYITIALCGLSMVSGCWRKKQVPPVAAQTDRVENSLNTNIDTHIEQSHATERLSGPAGAPELCEDADCK